MSVVDIVEVDMLGVVIRVEVVVFVVVVAVVVVFVVVVAVVVVVVVVAVLVVKEVVVVVVDVTSGVVEVTNSESVLFPTFTMRPIIVQTMITKARLKKTKTALFIHLLMLL